MSKIERQMIAEARAAREAQQQRQDAADIGADVPSAPNDEQTQDVQWWQYAHIIGTVPPLCRDDDAIPQVQPGVPASGRPKWWDDKNA